MSIINSYRGKTVALATLHQKGALAQEPFKEILGMDVEEVKVDTDQFGTFSGDVERTLTPREALMAKAQLGLTHSQSQYALASEGTIGVDPLIGFLNSDIEHVGFFDSANNLFISHSYRSFDIQAHTHQYRSEEDLNHFLKRADFPHHKLIVKSFDDGVQPLAKGISKHEDLMKVLHVAVDQGLTKITIESDLRAHASPSRAANIKQAFTELAERINTPCPDCDSPGWGITSSISGLTCLDCGEETEAIKAYLYSCIACAFTEQSESVAEGIDPSRCNWCNP
jgi:hypothetical protein